MKTKRIPRPDELAADVIVSGHTSTARKVDVVKVGDMIPVTFSNDLLRNTPGFTWYVSKNYALKTDFPPKMAKDLLILLELAFPHYVALFGREMPELRDRRMGCIYGASMESLERAMVSDEMNVFGGGGITQEGFWCTYQRPSNPYHTRYILVHECVHLYQYCLNGTTTNTAGSFVEGVADLLSSHVFDPKKRQLTVNVLDRAPVHNFLEYGINFMKQHKRLSLQKVSMGSDRGVNVLITAYLQRTPELAQRWRIYRDETFRLATPLSRGETIPRILRQLYGPWGRQNASFRRWIKSLGEPTFHQAEWGFEQYGNKLVSFGTPRDKKNGHSQMDINLVPGRKPEPSWHRMDYPPEEVSPLVGPVKRGVRNPSVGCLVDMSPAHGKGRAGFALGRKGLEHVAILVEGEDGFVTIQGPGTGLARKRVRMPAALQGAMKKDGWKAGLTATIGDRKLTVLVRAGQKPVREFTVSVSISRRLRRRLMTQPMAVLGVGGWHLITPYMDDCRLMTRDPMTPAPANRRGFGADAELYRAYKTCWRLGGGAPAGLKRIKAELLSAAERPQESCAALIEEFRAALPAAAKKISGGGKAEKNRLALLDLSGLTLDVLLREKQPGKCVATAVIKGPVGGEAAGKVAFYLKTATQKAKLCGSGHACAKAGGFAEVECRFNTPAGREPFSIETKADLRWHGVPVSLRQLKTGRGGFPEMWMIGPFDNEGKLQDKAYDLIEKANPIDLQRVHPGQAGNLIMWRPVERRPGLPIDFVNNVYLVHLFGEARNSYAYAWARVDSKRDVKKAVLSVGASDALSVWVNGKKVHERITGRDWSPDEDKIPVELHKGVNDILLKSMHGGGLWFLSPQLLDEAGYPLDGIRTLACRAKK